MGIAMRRMVVRPIQLVMKLACSAWGKAQRSEAPGRTPEIGEGRESGESWVEGGGEGGVLSKGVLELRRSSPLGVMGNVSGRRGIGYRRGKGVLWVSLSGRGVSVRDSGGVNSLGGSTESAWIGRRAYCAV